LNFRQQGINSQRLLKNIIDDPIGRCIVFSILMPSTTSATLTRLFLLLRAVVLLVLIASAVDRISNPESLKVSATPQLADSKQLSVENQSLIR
jgi:hypothetical protein